MSRRFIISSILMILATWMGCTPNTSSSSEATANTANTMNSKNSSPPTDERWDTQLKVEIPQGTLVYFATVARNPAEWAANHRIAVLASGEVLYAHNSIDDEMDGRTFAGEMKQYKILAKSELEELISKLRKFHLENLPSLVRTPEGHEVFDGGDDYLYWNEGANAPRFIKIEAAVPIGDSLREILLNL